MTIRASLRITLLLAVVVVLSACSIHPGVKQAGGRSGAAQRAGESLLGRYEFSSGDRPYDIFMAVNVREKAGTPVLNFQASHPDGHGAAPEGSGTGKIGADGVFHFTYSDNFGNRGTGTFRRSRSGYAISIDIKSIADSRCMAFYGDFDLQRVKSGN